MTPLAIAVVAPAVVLAWAWRAAPDASARRQTLAAFGAGLAAALVVAALALPLRSLIETAEAALGAEAAGAAPAPSAAFLSALLGAFGGAAIPEEALKLLGLLLLLRFARGSAGSVLVAGALVGLGFAAFEAVVHAVHHGSAPVAATRTLTALPCHVLLGAVMGSYVAAWRARRRAADACKALALPVLLHGLYDLPLLAATTVPHAGDPDATGALLLAALVLITLAAWVRTLAASSRRPHRASPAPGRA